ncbi:MAG: protein translocase subunit SecD [Patescibacteria group bacterium]
MLSKRSRSWPTISIIIAILVVIIALPQDKRTFVPSFLKSPKLHYGLDLIGGTQLDFRISEREMREQTEALQNDIARMEEEGAPPDRISSQRAQLQTIEEQQRTIVEAIRTVLERRINAMGVSEAVITPSYIGNEKHLLVECPGVVDTQACINTVGKTIKLEFKEEYTEATDEFENEVFARVESALARITESGETLSVVGQDLSDELGVGFDDEQEYFYDQLPGGLEKLWDQSPDYGVKKVEGNIKVPERTEDGVRTREIPGIFISEVIKPKETKGRVITDPSLAFEHLANTMENAVHKERTDFPLENVTDPVQKSLSEMAIGEVRTVQIDDETSALLHLSSRIDGVEEMEASHILIAYKNALSVEETVERSRDEAETLAEELRVKIEGGESFEDTARTYSDGPSGAEGGSLGVFGRGMMVPPFEAVAFELGDGEISAVTETQFGFHIIRADKAPVRTPDKVNYDSLVLNGTEDLLIQSEDLAAQVREHRIEREEEVAFMRSLFFSLLPSGWKDTSLDGKHFRSATVTLDPTTNLPVVQIIFDTQGAELFQELTKVNIGKRIAIFVGGDLVSAPTVQTEIAGGIAIITGSSTFEEAKKLAQDLNTGAIPAPIYLAGQRTVEATLGAQALHTSVEAALIGIAILMLFMILMYRLMGLLADIALLIYALIFLAVLKLPLFLFSDQYIVLTLAGMAGIILSIGMAVDANILIFERIKEELKKGKIYKTAVETGFERAWPSIRDGNVSTFITCIILFTVGTSIVRGFAATLGMGVLISMFSAIVITRFLMKQLGKSPLSENLEMFGVKVDV